MSIRSARCRHRDVGAGTRGHVGELRSNVATAKEYDPARQRLELEEAVTRHHVISARETKPRWTGTTRDDDVPGFECLTGDVDRIR